MSQLSSLRSFFVVFIIFCSSCSNYFKDYFKRDNLLNHYKPDLISATENPALLFTKNVELEEISLMENGMIKMGYSFFESDGNDLIDEAKKFAKEIGASVVLIKENFERVKTEHYQSPGIHSVIPSYVSVNPDGVVLPYYAPVTLNIEFDDDGKTKQSVSINQAAQIWGTPYYERDYYAVVHGTDAVVLKNRVQDYQVEVFSYYASFWAKTNYPPALGVEVADIVSDVRKKLGINYGVVAWGVFRDSPAAFAGISRGDYLIRINDEPIVSRLQMGELIRKNTGKEVEIEMIQGEERVTKTVQLRETTF